MKKLYIFFLLLFNEHILCEPSVRSLPPIPPPWIFGHWVWEDNENTEAAVRDLVSGYLDRDIPVDVVVIDSPWETNYNTFEFDPGLYPTAVDMIENFHSQNIKIVVWITSIINKFSFDGPDTGKSPNYRFPNQNGYFINNGQLFRWWKGWGSYIDYTHPQAVEWWHGEMDKALDLGIDGWKPDAGTRMFPSVADCWAGQITKKEYSRLYYKDFFEYTRSRNIHAVNFTKPLDENPADSTFVPNEYSTAAWVGDQQHTWDSKGLLNALSNMFISSQRGFTAVGSDIGGFMGSMEITKQLFIRWTQLGALCPVMINGGFGEHRPWMYDTETLDIYKYYVALHRQLTPYFYSYAVSAHHDGRAIMRPQGGDWQYKLGEELFVPVMYMENDHRDITFPADADWIDFWDDDRIYPGGTTLENFAVPPAQYPIFIKAGAIIPMDVSNSITQLGTIASAGYITLLLYPNQISHFTLYQQDFGSIPIQSTKFSDSTTIEIGANDRDFICRVKYDHQPQLVRINRSVMPELDSQEELDQRQTGWIYDTPTKKTIIKLSSNGLPNHIAILDSGFAVPVSLSDFHAHYHLGRITLYWTTDTEKNNYGFNLKRRSGKKLWKKIAFIPGSGTRTRSKTYSYMDNIEKSGTYYYKLEQIDHDGRINVLPEISVKTASPQKPDVLQNHPNPFNSSTRIKIHLSQRTNILLTITNLAGRRVKTFHQGTLAPGVYTFTWDGRDEQHRWVAGGVYFGVLHDLDTGEALFCKIVLLR